MKSQSKGNRTHIRSDIANNILARLLQISKYENFWIRSTKCFALSFCVDFIEFCSCLFFVCVFSFCSFIHSYKRAIKWCYKHSKWFSKSQSDISLGSSQRLLSQFSRAFNVTIHNRYECEYRYFTPFYAQWTAAEWKPTFSKWDATIMRTIRLKITETGQKNLAAANRKVHFFPLFCIEHLRSLFVCLHHPLHRNLRSIVIGYINVMCCTVNTAICNT